MPNGSSVTQGIIDAEGNAITTALITVPSGYTGDLDSNGNLTVTGPVANAVPVTVDPAGAAPAFTLNVQVWPLPEDVAVGDLADYTLTAGDGTIKSATSEAKTYTVGFQTTGTASGTRGITLERSASGRPVGITYREAGTNLWDMGVDATTHQLVLAYSYERTADLIRLDEQAHIYISDTAGPPSTTTRLQLQSTAADAAGTVVMLKSSIASGSPMDSASGYHYIAEGPSGVVTHITRLGYAAFGFAYGGTVTNGGLEAINAVSVRATDITPTLRLARRGTTVADWNISVESSGAGQFVIQDNASGRRPIILRTTAPDALIYGDTNGLSLGVSGGKIGFLGATTVTRRAATADATDLASVITLANALKADLVAYGLKTA
jgi:hypothetical protein